MRRTGPAGGALIDPADAAQLDAQVGRYRAASKAVGTRRAYVTQGLLGAELLNSGPIPSHAVGQIAEANDGSEWVYGLCTVAMVAGYACALDTSFNATPITTALAGNPGRGFPVGIAPIAMNQGDYGWFQRRGPVQVQVAANTAARARMNTTAVPGVLGTDATVGSVQIDSIALVAAQGAAPGIAAASGPSFFATTANN